MHILIYEYLFQEYKNNLKTLVVNSKLPNGRVKHEIDVQIQVFFTQRLAKCQPTPRPFLNCKVSCEKNLR